MKPVPQTSCIIPFWNEGRRLYDVLDEVVKIKNVAQIICVDDDSQKDMSVDIRKRYPTITLIRLEKNVGKSGAIKEGLKIANSEFILLLDADLRNLDHNEIEIGNNAIQQTQNIDMIIFRRVKAPLIIKIVRGDVIVTGERILRKGDLETILNGSVKGWQLESAINTWMYKHKKKVFWVPHSGMNTHKPWKWGLVNGLKHDVRTFVDMISATGFINLIKQILFFGKNEFKLK